VTLTRHIRRRVVDLAGTWDFAFLGDAGADAGADSIDPAAIRFDDVTAVPGCFDATPRYAGRRGLAAYRTTLTLHDAGPHRLVVDGAHHVARFFLLDAAGRAVPLGEHHGGFTRFSFDIRDREPGEYALIALIDNRVGGGLSDAPCPLHLDYFDWRHYGGLSRGVELHRLGGLWLDDVRVTTTDWKAGRVHVALRWAADTIPADTPLRIVVDGRALVDEAVGLSGRSGIIERELTIPDARPWSPDSPHLHTLEAHLGDDDWRLRVGVRQVRVDGRDILLNGEPIKLRGFNRHEGHPHFGHAVPLAVQLADVQILKAMHCNFVRGSHYPQDERFLDLCDQAGLLVWSEAIGWQHSAEHLTDERFLKLQEQQIDEMLAAAANHPSVILWGILNESESQKIESRPAYERLLGRLRAGDPSRPVTFASNHPYDDQCMDLCDVISVNTYPAWYWGELADIGKELDRVVNRMRETGMGGRPLIIAEIGGGAVPGCRDWGIDRWGEPYQAEIVAESIRQILGQPEKYAGIAIWQYCDVVTSASPRRALMRPRGFNNKGIVDEYRRPKQAFAVVRQLFEQFGAMPSRTS
jgi:beta-glucuronidase